MMKIEKEYIKEYGDISIDSVERYIEALDTYKIGRYKTKIYDNIKRINNIKWKKISFTIYLLPKATPRPRCSSNGIFYVKGAKDNKKFFQKYMVNREDIKLINTPTKFYCTSYFPIPKSMKPVEKLCAELGYIYPISKPDWDNIAKAYCDMIQGFLISDDSLIIEGTSKKRYSFKPRIEIELEYMEDFDSVYNASKKHKKGGI